MVRPIYHEPRLSWSIAPHSVRHLIFAAVFSCGIAGVTIDAQALSEKNFQGSCKTKFQAWKKHEGFGAAAIARNGHCGFSWDYASLEKARQVAISSCRFGGKGKGCVVVAEKKTPSSHVILKRDCETAGGQARIDACTKLIDSKKDKGKGQAWNYNLRGIARKNQGYLDLAIDDYTNAIKSDRSYVWAHMNRAVARNELGQYESALSDAEFALKHYKKGGDDYRRDAKVLAAKLRETLSTIRNLPIEKLCALAMVSARNAWDDAPRYSSHVKEAKRRGLSIESCGDLVSAH
jgi:tetratricopeptide (TPR) repeat protein